MRPTGRACPSPLGGVTPTIPSMMPCSRTVPMGIVPQACGPSGSKTPATAWPCTCHAQAVIYSCALCATPKLPTPPQPTPDLPARTSPSHINLRSTHLATRCRPRPRPGPAPRGTRGHSAGPPSLPLFRYFPAHHTTLCG